MKKRLFLCLMVSLVNLLNGQTYILDNTYGTQGYKTNDNYLLNPKGLLKLNQSYFYYSNNEISKTNYNGSLNSSFGVNSKLTFNNSNETYTINGGKIINNYIYLFGKIVNTNNNSEDGFILKISEDGIYDTAFGINGISKVNLGDSENIIDFCIDNSGKLFCTAIKTNNNIAKVITFKLLSNGLIDTGFGTNSFKEYIFNPIATLLNTNVNKIIKLTDGYLLIGKTVHTELSGSNTLYNSNLVIAKIDEDGNYITSFGTSGIKLINILLSHASYSIDDIQLVNANLYVNIFGASSFNNQNRFLLKININNFQTIFSIPIYFQSNFKLDANENIYIVGSDRCDLQPCIRDFMLKKFDSSGNIDTSFAQNGTYTYSFPGLAQRDYQSSVVNLEEDGKIVIGGYLFRDFFNLNNVYVSPKYGLGSIRIEQGILNNDSFNLNEKISVFPNPVTDVLNLISKDEIKEIKIFDLQNKLILIKNNVINNSINLIELQAGLYVVKITTNNITTFKKFIKK